MIRIPTSDELAGELTRLEVPFLMPERVGPALEPIDLLVGLASSDEARLQMALIPLLICYPSYSEYVPTADALLDADSRTYLRCYHTAAMLLQRKHDFAALEDGAGRLPDLFGRELGLPADGTADELLVALGRRQSTVTFRGVNWVGTYGHGVRFLPLK